MTTETITRKEACELIRSYIGKSDGPKGEDLDKIVFAVNNDYQVRDFMLGLPEYYDVQEIVNFLSHMSNEAPVGKDVPFITVNAAFAYEHDQLQDFFSQIGYSATHRPNYSLNKLLMRVAAAGYPGELLGKMRAELASVVMKACYTDTPDRVITSLEDPDKDTDSTQTNL
jgi:hypothetical protein